MSANVGPLYDTPSLYEGHSWKQVWYPWRNPFIIYSDELMKQMKQVKEESIFGNGHWEMNCVRAYPVQ